jgi:hypothetical protein
MQVQFAQGTERGQGKKRTMEFCTYTEKAKQEKEKETGGGRVQRT